MLGGLSHLELGFDAEYGLQVGIVGEDISERAPCFTLDELRRRGKNSHPEKLAESGEIRAADYVPRFADGGLLDFTDLRNCASRLPEHSFGEAQRPVAR